MAKLTKKGARRKSMLDKFKQDAAKKSTESVDIEMQVGKRNVLVAALVPSNISNGQSYIDEANAYTSTTDHLQEVELCWTLYENEGIVGSAIDKHIDLAITPGTVENVKNPELRSLIEYWIANVNNLYDERDLKKLETKPTLNGKTYSCVGLFDVVSSAFLHWLISGDAVLYETWAKKVDVPALGGKYTLPKNINVYDIRNIEVDESLDSLGIEILRLRVDNDIKDIVKAGSSHPLYQQLVEVLGDGAISEIAAGSDSVTLPPILTTHFKRRGHGRMYGVPFLKRAFNSIASKRRLQALDEATISGMIQRLTIIMLGHKDKDSPYHRVPPGRVAALKRMLAKPKTMTVGIWGGPDLDYIDIGPDGKVLSFEKRFNEADDGISLALGFPRILIDGHSSGTSERDWVILISTITMLERAREMFAQRISRWFRSIAIKNGFEDEFPVWRWSSMALRDEKSAKTLTVKLFESGLLGYEDSLNDLGYPGKQIIEKRIKEVEEGLMEKLPAPSVSFGRSNSPTGGRPDGAIDDPSVDRGGDSTTAEFGIGPNARALIQDSIMACYSASYGGFADYAGDNDYDSVVAAMSAAFIIGAKQLAENVWKTYGGDGDRDEYDDLYSTLIAKFANSVSSKVDKISSKKISRNKKKSQILDVLEGGKATVQNIALDLANFFDKK